MRTYDTGATRNSVAGKLRYEGYFSPLVLQARAEYMQKHQTQADGVEREADNWQKGMPLNDYMDSAFRHFMSWWLAHRGHAKGTEMQEAICALMFNAEGYMHALLTATSEEVDEQPETMREFVESLFTDPLEPVEDAPEIPLPPKNFGRPMNPRTTDVVCHASDVVCHASDVVCHATEVIGHGV
jgi:hypothetical protein